MAGETVKPGSREEGTPSGQQPASASPTNPAPSPTRRLLAEQELRLISTLVVMLGVGLFLALPFVLSIGSVVFLPITTALILTIILSPLADKFGEWGVPNVLSSLLSITLFLALLVAALLTVLQPALDLIDQLPAFLARIGERIMQLRGAFAWIADAAAQMERVLGSPNDREVVVASPSLIQQLALATPSVLVETLVTFLMAFFMIEARGRWRRQLLLGRTDYGASLKAARVLRDVQDRVAQYFATVATINFVIGVIVSIGAWSFGMTAPLMWGGLAGLLNFLPYLGPMAMTVFLTLYGLSSDGNVAVALIPAFAYIGLHTIEANVVTPSVLGVRFTINPVVILIAISYFAWIWGVVGALLSVPIVITLKALFQHIGKPNLLGFAFGETLFPQAAERVDPA
ncbi:AI-2E family transporter [Pseudoblastomonas halimionae]|uniref:AI-2E family transporter n=1 Tax=Alteriqipengyuania halimionae TaxID=1926630 RepID=A0A6I4U3K3_9SPHN|nr:AI-2E family transporter [Alteriqipengyuania halimionae]MXP10518.1 AI-2E family transporter [Alteriqipengyuania halimionae]